MKPFTTSDRLVASGRLLVFDTHPIQYRAPVFQSLFAQHPNFKVFFFNEVFEGRRWWFQEVGKIPPQNFGVSLREGYPNEVLGTARWNFYWKWKRLKALISQEKPQAILIYGYYLPEHWVLRLLSARLGVPLLFVGETFDWRGSSLRQTLKKTFVKQFFKHVSSFISIGEKTFRYYQSWGISPEKITRGSYCIDPKFFQLDPAPAQAARAKVRAELGIPADAFVVLFVGRLFDRKRPQDVIEVHRRLDLPRLHTLMVGNGEMQEELTEKAAGAPRLHLLGFKNQREIRDIYYASDLLFVPSEFETWGLVVNEAFACGRPALVTDTCGVAHDLVVPQENGDVFTVGDLTMASKVVASLVENPTVAEEWGANAREKLIAEYRPENFAAAVLKSLAQVTPAAQ